MLTLDGPMILREALQRGVSELRAADVPSAPLAAELLLLHVLGVERAWLYAHSDDPITAAALAGYRELLRRRTAGTPTQYLTGRQEFWGLEFVVTPDVLIPRPETEHVVEVALERTRGKSEIKPLRVADVGTGSGCLAVALAHELPEARVYATEISPQALAVARRNAARHGVADRIVFLEANLLGPFAAQSFDLIASNPPYVGRGETASLPREVREHEPAAALFAGEQGPEIYPQLIAQAVERLAEGGALVMELGYGAGERVRALLDPDFWKEIAVTNDLAGIPRVLAAARTSLLPAGRQEGTLVSPTR